MLEKEKSLFEQLLYSARLTMSYYLDPNRDKGEKPITSFEHRKVFESYPKSIAQFMPFIDFDMDTNVFTFDDCTTTAMVFDVKPIATEGRSESQIADYAAAIDRALSSTFEEHEEHEGEWVFQQFRWKDDDLQSLVDDALLYTNSDIRESEFTQVMLNQVMRKHLNSVSREGGLFFDDKVTKTPFEGGIERTKIIFYRKSRKSSKKNRRQDPVKEITAKAKALKSMLQSYGVELLENNDFDFFHWLVKFFNEAPEGVDQKTWYESITPSKTKRGSLPDDIPAALFTQRPKFNEQDSCYEIGSKTYKIVRVGGLNQTTVFAQLTGELSAGENVKCFTDSMPSGTMMCMTTVFCSKTM